jgi:hypothetical protein
LFIMMLFHDRLVIDGVTVFKDDARPYTYYLLPAQPRFRLDDNGCPIFKFIKYRVPIERADGLKNGGFVIFDVEFVVPEETRAKLKKALEAQIPANVNPKPSIEFADVAFTKGTSTVRVLQENGALVQAVRTGGKPSMFGNFVTSVSVELTDVGATVVEQALQGKGGAVQVWYDMTCAVKLPPVKIDGTFHAEQFYSFFQTINVEWRMWRENSYREKVSEQLRQSESTTLTVDPGPLGATNPELVNDLRSWAQKALEDAVARNMLSAATPVGGDDRKRPEGVDELQREITTNKISDVSIRIRENAVIEYNVAPQGTLPNITSLVDKQNKPIVWTDYATTISADDPFFRELRVRASVNADMKALPIHSVDVTLKYDSSDGEKVVSKGVKSADDVVALDAYLKGDNRTYQYMYKVNYVGADRAMTYDWQNSDSPFITINVGDLGYLSVDVTAGDIDFTQIKSALVVMTYEDADAGVARIEDQFELTQATPTHKAFGQVIYKPAAKPYRYTVTYRMADGSEIRGTEQESRSPQLFVNDSFVALETINLRTWGNLETHIQTVFLDLEYVDEAAGYRKRHSSALSKERPFAEWEFPVMHETGGKITYRGEYILRDGTRIAIPSTETTERTLLFGLAPPDTANLNIEVLADLLDFSAVKLAKIAVEYQDQQNAVIETGTTVFRAGAPTSWKWTIPIKNKTKRDYTWSATFFMADGSQRSLPSQPTTDSMLVLQLPAT